MIPKDLDFENLQDGRYHFLKNGEIHCDAPNADLYEFMGQLRFDDRVISLTENQLLLKGSKLMNTKWAMGAVVYTGLDTKLLQN